MEGSTVYRHRSWLLGDSGCLVESKPWGWVSASPPYTIDFEYGVSWEQGMPQFRAASTGVEQVGKHCSYLTVVAAC